MASANTKNKDSQNRLADFDLVLSVVAVVSVGILTGDYRVRGGNNPCGRNARIMAMSI